MYNTSELPATELAKLEIGNQENLDEILANRKRAQVMADKFMKLSAEKSGIDAVTPKLLAQYIVNSLCIGKSFEEIEVEFSMWTGSNVGPTYKAFTALCSHVYGIGYCGNTSSKAARVRMMATAGGQRLLAAFGDAPGSQDIKLGSGG